MCHLPGWLEQATGGLQQLRKLHLGALTIWADVIFVVKDQRSSEANELICGTSVSFLWMEVVL